MHELSIAEALLEVCEREVAAHGGATIEALRVAVGELSGVEPELLKFAWEGLSTGTRHHGSTLEVDFRRAGQTCPACGEIAERAPGSWLRLCPQCERPLQIEGGDELDLLSLTLLEEPDGSR